MGPSNPLPTSEKTADVSGREGRDARGGLRARPSRAVRDLPRGRRPPPSRVSDPEHAPMGAWSARATWCTDAVSEGIVRVTATPPSIRFRSPLRHQQTPRGMKRRPSDQAGSSTRSRSRLRHRQTPGRIKRRPSRSRPAALPSTRSRSASPPMGSPRAAYRTSSQRRRIRQSRFRLPAADPDALRRSSRRQIPVAPSIRSRPRLDRRRKLVERRSSSQARCDSTLEFTGQPHRPWAEHRRDRDARSSGRGIESKRLVFRGSLPTLRNSKRRQPMPKKVIRRAPRRSRT